MTTRLKNHGLSANKNPDGISVRTTGWGAEVCVSRHDDTLTLTVYHDGDDTGTTVEILLTSNPKTQSATFVAPRSLDDINRAEINRAMYRMLCERRIMRDE